MALDGGLDDDESPSPPDLTPHEKVHFLLNRIFRPAILSESIALERRQI